MFNKTIVTRWGKHFQSIDYIMCNINVRWHGVEHKKLINKVTKAELHIPLTSILYTVNYLV